MTGATPGKGPVNPFTSIAETPIKGPAVTDLATARKAVGTTVGNPGQIGYTPINNATGGGTTSYAVFGGGSRALQCLEHQRAQFWFFQINS